MPGGVERLAVELKHGTEEIEQVSGKESKEYQAARSAAGQTEKLSQMMMTRQFVRQDDYPTLEKEDISGRLCRDRIQQDLARQRQTFGRS